MFDDTGGFEPGEIDNRDKKDGITARVDEGECQIVAYRKSNRLFAASAFRLDIEGKGLISQHPLHEGGRYGVRSSGGPEPLTA